MGELTRVLYNLETGRRIASWMGNDAPSCWRDAAAIQQLILDMHDAHAETEADLLQRVDYWRGLYLELKDEVTWLQSALDACDEFIL